MRLTKNDGKVGVALGVLKYVKVPKNDVVVQTYSNCREQGLFLSRWFTNQERAVSFAENRNSDDIVVQFGVRSDFDSYGVLNEKAYKTNKKYFNYNQHEEAGTFITKWLNAEGI